MPEVLKKPRRNAILTFACCVLLLGGCCWYLDISLLDLITSFPDFISFFLNKFCPPDFSTIGQYIPDVLDTIFFAITATYVSSAFAIFFGLMMSSVVNPIGWLRTVFRMIASFFRNIPVMIWAALLIYAFGIGELVGLIALVLATIGFLSRSYADSVNEIDQKNLEALKAVGASPLQILWHGTLVLFRPACINWTLYCFELNIRSSTLLGMVGAGGIGVQIQTCIKLFKYHTAFAIIIVVIAMVLLTEFCTNQLRKRIR